MTPERYKQIGQILEDALERKPAEREAFVNEACSGDEALRGEVESLLRAHEQAGSFIDAPPAEAAAILLADRRAQRMAGRKLGHYQLLSLLGAGGMGEVYRAYDTHLDREVAIKILPEHLARHPEALRRFEREAKIVAALSHPNILAIHDFATEQGVSYAVMELLDGETLRARLTRSPLGWRSAVEIGIAIAEGLAAAHAKGVVHRDLKPENIFLTEDGQVKILDFGIARMKHIVTADAETLKSTATETTRPGVVMGTIGYMSPEQVRGAVAEASSDTFSFGSVSYEMLTGQSPFARETAAETIAAILKEEPPPLSDVKPKIPGELERIIRHCLEKKLGARFQSARDLAFDLKSVAGGGGAITPAAARAAPRLHPLWIGTATLGLLLLVTSLYLLLGRERAIDSLAVLPLVNASGDANADYLSDGITENLINSLSQLPALRVMAHSTVFNYKGQKVDPQEVGRKLKVGAVVTGRVTQRGETLSVATELVKVADGSQLWGKLYQQKLTDVIILQVEIAKQISEQLRLTLTGEQRRRLSKHYTENPEAFLLYTRGRHQSSNFWTADGFNKGIDLLRQAIALDPAYALPHAGLATTYYEASSVVLPSENAMPKAKAAALTALSLDETLAEAHTALGLVLAYYEWNWPEAKKHYERALALKPSYAQAHLYYGQYLIEKEGALDAGIEQIKQAQRLDPLTPSTSMLLPYSYFMTRRYDEAVPECLKIIEMDPKFFLAHSILGQVYEQQGKLPEAIAEFNLARQLDPKQPFTLGYLGHAYALAGKPEEARKLLGEMKEIALRNIYVDPVAVAHVHAGLGDKDQTIEWLEKAYRDRDENFIHYKDSAIFDLVRKDPRFVDLLRRMNLAP